MKTSHRGSTFFILSGSSGGGKSTLLRELADRGHAVVPEAGRQLVQEQQQYGGVINPGTELFGHLLLSRSIYLYNQALENCLSRPTFFDRSIIEPLAYSHSLGQMQPHYDRAIATFRYAHDVFMVPPWPEIFVKDDERQHSYDPEQREYHRLLDAFESFGYRTHILPKVSVAERADYVEAHLREIKVL